jgi:DNA primase
LEKSFMAIIEDIKERIKLEDLVAQNSAIRLRKTGASLVGFCPFHHNDKTPALVIWPGTQTWKCFGCNEGGDVFDWVMKQNPGWDIQEAIRALAGQAGIQLKPEGQDLQTRLTSQAKEETLKIAMRVFRKWLLGETDKAGNVVREPDAEALNYALDRGWTLETIKAAGIGFSGRATAAQVNEMRGEFQMHGIDPLSPAAIIVLGFRGEVATWAQAHGLDPNDLGENYIQGLISKPGLVYAHKADGKVEYLSERLLPGVDEQRKSHNPSAALAGPRRPYFNWLHRSHHAEGQEKGKRIHLVEGQGDAVTWGQFGEPAMALCGSSWRYLEETGLIALLKNEYQEICYTADADAPGERVLTGGEKMNFPLSTAFGPTLWVERAPKIEWTRPDGKPKKIKDTNDLAQYFQDAKLEEDERKRLITRVIERAEPIVVLAARYAGQMEGQLKQNAIESVVRPLLVAMPGGRRINYADALAEALYPSLSKTNQRTLYNKWLTGELRKAAQEDDDEDDQEPEYTLGGWYPDDETENSGYLLDVYYDQNQKRVMYAYAHITDMRNNVREIATAPFLVIKGQKYEPPADENIESGAVKLPSALGELKTAAFLIEHMAEYYRKYFYLEEKSRYRFCGSYALFTWVHDCFEALNFLRARGGSGSGKSDLMYLVGLTSYRFAVTLSISSSASYKGIAKLYRATVMIDEADNLMKKDDGTMEAFLKGRSMKRYSNAMNMMEVMGPNGKTFVPTTTNVYGPTLITMYHNFKDPGIENRCVTFDLSQVDTFTLEQEGMEPGYYPPELESDAEQIRNWALRWRLETWQKKIELSPEQRKAHKLADPLVSPRVNQVLRPMKVLAVLQNDLALLEELKLIGQTNYEDEMIKRAGSFEALILRAVVAADIAADIKTQSKPQSSQAYAEKVKGYGEKVKVGKLGAHGVVRYILYKDLAEIANQMMDVENTGDADDKKKAAIKGKTIGDVARDSFRMPVQRTNEGWAVVLDRSRIEISKLRFGLDREADYKPEPEPEPAPEQAELNW